MQSEEGPKKSSQAKLWEYAVKIAVQKGEIQEHEGISILHCWGEAEQIQDTNEAKAAKFKKLLSMKFGPKANHLLELITKAKEKVQHMVQQRQQIKQQQQSGSQDQSMGSGNASSQETLPMSQLSSVSPSPTMFSGPPPQQTQPPYMQMNMGQYAPHQAQPQQPQFTGYGSGGALPSVPVGMTGGGYVPPQQQGPPLLTPISQMAGGQSTVHGTNGLPNMHHGNVPGIHSGGGAGLSIPGNHLLGGAPGIGGGNNPGPNMGSAMIYNNHPGYPPRPMAPNFTPGALNSNPLMNNMMAQGMAKKGPVGAAAGNKRSAGAAGMDADAKGGKKKAPPQMGQPGQYRPGMGPGPGQQPFGPGLLSGGPGAAAGGPNRPLNTPGGANFFYNNPPAAGAGPGAGQGQGQGGAGPAGNGSSAAAEPLTVAQELEAMTEKPNSVAEGLEPVGEGAVAAPLITPDFVRQENEAARMRAAAGFRPAMGPGSGPGQHTAASMMQRLNIPGVPNVPIDPEHVWQCANIVDKSMMGRAAMKVLEGTELKLGGACLSLLSNGIQLHLKNVLESAYRLSRSRQNHTAISSYASISRMIVEHGKGRALAPMLQNVGMHWGDDVRGILSAEEAQARRLLRQYDTALEEVLQGKMRAADEERQRMAGNKRRPGTDDAAWWTKEDAAEKSGLLGWADLAHVSFKQSVARKHDLGAFASTSRTARSKNSAAAAQAAAAAAQASAEQAGRGADAEAAMAAAEATLRALTAPQGASPTASSHHGSQDSTHGSNPELASQGGAGASNGGSSGAPNSNSASDWTRQPCPLHLTQRTGKIVIQEEDLAVTLERSTHNRGLPGTVLSGVRPTGSCLYKHKMGVYAETVAAAAANTANVGISLHGTCSGKSVARPPEKTKVHSNCKFDQKVQEILMPGIVIRVRTKVGTWRVADVASSDTFADLRKRIEVEHNADLQGVPFTSDPAGTQTYLDHMTVGDAKLTNGHMIYAMVDESKVGAHEKTTLQKTIRKDGTIVTQDVTSVFNTTGFRPGMLPLRNMKMHWTLNEFISLDEQFQYKVKSPEGGMCKLVSVDKASVEEFQTYMRNFDFRVMRVAYLYGKFIEESESKEKAKPSTDSKGRELKEASIGTDHKDGKKMKVQVECIYEPPQESTDTSFTLLPDSKEQLVEGLAGMLGLQKVGWIFSHPTREEGFHFSGAEVMFAAEQQLEAAQGVNETPFVTMKLTINEKHEIIVEAFQVSLQCMEMVAEGVISPSKHLGAVEVNPTFTAIVEGKPAKEIDTNFFLSTTPIEQFESTFLVSTFPRANRIDVLQTRDDIKTQLSKVGKKGWTFSDLLADFQLLLYLCNFLSPQEDLPLLCKAVTDREVPLDDGYQLLIRSIAGMD